MQLNSKLALPLTGVFALTTLIMVIVAIAGSTGNYTPLKHVYVGQLNLTHLNISKVLPELSPILTVIGTGLASNHSNGNGTENDPLKSGLAIFKNLTNTTALNPLLTILSNAENITSTIGGLDGLNPLKDVFNSSSQNGPLNEIHKLIDNFKNHTDILKDLSNLMAVFEGGQSDQNPAATLFQQFKDSSDIGQSANALGSFNGLLSQDNDKLQPLFDLFNHANNDKADLGFLGKILNSTFSQSTVNNTFQKLEHTAEKDLNKTLDQLKDNAPQPLKPAFDALKNLVLDSKLPNETISVLHHLIDNKNSSKESDFLKKAVQPLQTLVDGVQNGTSSLDWLRQLSNQTHIHSTGNQLDSLVKLFNSTLNGTQIWGIIDKLKDDLNQKSGNLPSLFQLLRGSKNTSATLGSLNPLTSWTSQNSKAFEPILHLLRNAGSVTPIGNNELSQLTPNLLQNSGLKTIFQLSIFTLCTAATGGNIDTCSKSHAVQSLDFGNFVWDALTNSDLSSLIKGLNLQKSNLNVAGKLTQRQGQWSPSMRAILSLGILIIIIVFVKLLTIGFVLISSSPYSNIRKLVLLSIASGFVLFTFIPAVVVTAILQRVKSASSSDNFGVTAKDGKANLALSWCSFALALLTLPIIGLSRLDKVPVLDKEANEKQTAEETAQPAVPANETYDGPTPVSDNEADEEGERVYHDEPSPRESQSS